jgi:acetyl esterase
MSTIKKNKFKWPLYLILSIFIFTLKTDAQDKSKNVYPPDIPNAKVEIYKSVDGVELKLWIFNPTDWKETDTRPAIVFFFGGGWRQGNLTQFVPHCKYLADRGMVTMVADYRVRNRHQNLANKCVQDAKSAMRFVRKNAARLGIDPDRIAAGGGSAGGHLAAATATLPEHNDPADDWSVNAKPNALVLFNPAVILESVPNLYSISKDKEAELKERMGVEAESMSPYHHVRTGICSTIIFHGIEDSKVPYKTVDLFRKKMRENQNRCELVSYHGQDHGFFNYGNNSNGAFIDSVRKMDAFLCSIGYLLSPPESIHQK